MGEYDKLGLYFPARLAGLDGEMFHYDVNFEAPVTQEKKQEVSGAIAKLLEPLNDEEKGTYTGDWWTGTPAGNQLSIELDLGNCRGPWGFDDKVVNSILLALNTVPGIREVVVNDGCDDYGMDEM